MVRASDLLHQAAEIVSGARAEQHGDMVLCHSAIATLWNGYLAIRREPGSPLSPLDVAQMMILLKVARAQSGSAGHADHYLDMAGYAGCAAEIAERVRE